MASSGITVPAAAGDFTNLSSDAANFSKNAYRRLLRFNQPEGLFTERVTVSGDKLYYRGHRIWLCHHTLSGGGALPSSDANARQIVNELKERGVNCVRIHHIDQKTSTGNGILVNSPVTNWYELESTQTAKLVRLIKELRRRGMWYSLDFNSLFGNDESTNAFYTPIANANAVVGSNITKVTTGSVGASVTQAVDSTTGLAAGMVLYFHTAGTAHTISSVDSATQVTLTTAVDTADNEVCSPYFSRFKMVYAYNAAARTQIHAYASGILALDVSVGSESGVTIADDPHNLYNTLTNEFLPSTTHPRTAPILLNQATGVTWSESNSAHRTLLDNQCITALAAARTFLASEGSGALIAWGSDFSSNRSEYTFRASVDIGCSHVYFNVTGGTGTYSSWQMDPPSQMGVTLDDIFTSHSSGVRFPTQHTNLPKILEECNSSDPNPFKFENPVYTAIYCKRQGWAGWGQFEYIDGNWDPSTIANMRQYDLHTDRSRDAAYIVGATLFLRDLAEDETATNFSGEDASAQTFYADTERTIVFCGNATASRTFTGHKAHIITINSGSARALVALSSFDPVPLYTAKRISVVHCTDVTKRNRAWTGLEMTNAGDGTECLSHSTATIRLYHQRPSNLTMYRVNHAGTLGSSVTASLGSGYVEWTLDNTSTDTIFYEIVETGTAV